MSDISPGFIARFTRIYAIVAVVITLVFGVAMAAFPNLLASPILRGALIGGSVGAILWPVTDFAQRYLQSEGRKPESRASWAYAIRFALRALLVNLGIGVVAVGLSFALGGVRGDEIGIALGVMGIGVGVGFVLLIPLFRLFIWSAFKGAEKRAARG